MLTLISFFWTIFWSLSCYPLLMSIVLWPLKHPLEILNWQIFYFAWWHTVYHILAGVEPLQWNLKPDLIFEKFLMSCEHALNSSTFVMRVIDTFLLFCVLFCILQSGWVNHFTVLRALGKMVCSLMYWIGFLGWLLLWLAFRPVVMQGHARQSHMAMPFPEKESNRSLGSTFSGLSFYIDTDISPELQHKVDFIKSKHHLPICL